MMAPSAADLAATVLAPVQVAGRVRLLATGSARLSRIRGILARACGPKATGKARTAASGSRAAGLVIRLALAYSGNRATASPLATPPATAFGASAPWPDRALAGGRRTAGVTATVRAAATIVAATIVAGTIVAGTIVAATIVAARSVSTTAATNQAADHVPTAEVVLAALTALAGPATIPPAGTRGAAATTTGSGPAGALGRGSLIRRVTAPVPRLAIGRVPPTGLSGRVRDSLTETGPAHRSRAKLGRHSRPGRAGSCRCPAPGTLHYRGLATPGRLRFPAKSRRTTRTTLRPSRSR